MSTPDHKTVEALADEFVRIGRERCAGLDPTMAEHTLVMSVVRALATLAYEKHERVRGTAFTVEDVAFYIRKAPWEASIRGMLDRRAIKKLTGVS